MTAPERVGRLAPSPTGAQHVGNARTYLITWLAARVEGARLRFRIEDIDSPRVKPWAVDQLAVDLAWLGLDWDGEPVRQTDRLDQYRDALGRLQEHELVYPCTCTRADIERAASAPHAEHEGPAYPGTCAHRQVADAHTLTDRPYCWRFRVTDSPRFRDRYVGEVAIDLRQLGGDFVVWKSDGSPAYQLAVVVDDAEMGVTDVIRGDDLLPSTPRQMSLYRALGWAPPSFTHVPLVVGSDGRRLAKRHGDTRLSSLREAGVRSEDLLGLLAESCGWLGPDESITALELLPRFRWETIPMESFVLTPERLARIGYRPGS